MSYEAEIRVSRLGHEQNWPWRVEIDVAFGRRRGGGRRRAQERAQEEEERGSAHHRRRGMIWRAIEIERSEP